MPENTDELLANIISEKNKGDSHDRYPIRFLFFPLSSELSPYLFTLINKLSLKVKRLSDYFPEDKWAYQSICVLKQNKMLNLYL